MKLAISEMERRRGIQLAYNAERGIEPTTIVKGVRDLNDRLRAVAEAPGAYVEAGDGRQLSDMSREQVERLVARMEAEMRSAARELEFEKAAALRDEIRQVRLRVLDEDVSVQVQRAADQAAASARAAGADADARRPVGRSGRGSRSGPGPATGRGPSSRRRDRVSVEFDAGGIYVSAVEVLPAEDEPAGVVTMPDAAIDEGTASDWLPGIRDEHDDEAGWQAKWLERQTWDHRVTPNVIRRTGQRPRRRR
jgi:hypothetical protein